MLITRLIQQLIHARAIEKVDPELRRHYSELVMQPKLPPIPDGTSMKLPPTVKELIQDRWDK